MHVDAMTIPQPLGRIGDLARRTQSAGFSGLLFTETGRTAYLNAAVASQAAPGLELSTGVAVAFPRSPFVTAATAWELQEATDGNFRLGLGTQVRTHVVRRYGVDFEPPGPRLRDYLLAVVEQARKDGYTSTVLGRRRYLPELDSTNRQVREAAERAALNAPIQGSAADIIKVAMIGVDIAVTAAGLTSRMLLQVHDELLFEVADGEREQLEALVRDKMGGAYPLDVPLEVSVGYGPSWDTAAH